MRKIVLLVIAILSTHFYAKAQTEANEESLLWRVSGKGMAKPSYLFGTIHLICPDDYLWTARMKQSLAASEKVCFEMDLDDKETMAAATEGFIDTSGKQLKDYFTATQYLQLKKFIKDSVGMDIAIFQQMKPIAIESIISMKATRCMMPVSYEEKIMTIAKEARKEILGLEPVSEQVTALDISMPADSVAAEVMEEINNFAKSQQEYADMVAVYKAQQLSKLYEKITASKTAGDNMSVLLDDRNRKWISRMIAKMAGSSVFFAVGAGHLAGPNGVISLLRKEGYTVEPVL